MEVRTAATRSVRFTYAVAGSGPAVVLLPGSGGWQLTFGDMLERLSATHTVYAVDPPGQGGTRVIDTTFGYDAAAVADALADLLTVLRLERVPVVGHSWGGGFALRLAQLHPGAVERLALLAPAGVVTRDVWEFRVLRRPGVGELATRLTSVTSVRHMLRKSFAHPERVPARPLIEQAAQRLRQEPSLRRDMLRIERGVDWIRTEQDLATIRCPVLIVWGDRDRYLPVRLLDRFTTALPQARIQVVQGAGHSVHDDDPAGTYPALVAFLDTSRAPIREGVRP